MADTKLTNLIQNIGNTDIYIIDQILKGRLINVRSMLDAGCGTGRNLKWFLNQPDLEITALDPDPGNLEFMRKQVLGDGMHPLFIESTIEDAELEPAHYDFIICNAVLHFARNKSHFESMLNALWNSLAPSGILFIRTASNIGIESLVSLKEDGVYHLPDGSDRYLVTHDQLIEYSKRLNGKLLDPIKTTNVQNLRCMTTWILAKL